MTSTLSVTATEQAIAAALTGLASLLPEVISTVQSGGKNIGADFSTAEDLAGVFASAAANLGGAVGSIAADVNAYLPFARAVTSSVIAQVSAAAPAAAPAPAAS